MSGGRPLAGLRVVLTRAAHQAGPARAAFEAAGATVELLPLLAIGPPPDAAAVERAAADLARFDAVAFTSQNAVAAFLPHLVGEVPPLAAVGPATAAALRRAGHHVALEAQRRDARGLARLLADALGAGARVLIPQADDARPELARDLRSAGLAPQPVVVYAKSLPAGAAARVRRLFAQGPLGWVVFTSPRIVEHFVRLVSDALGDAWPRRRRELRAVAIGPTTATALRRHGIEPIVARQPTPDALVAAVIAARGCFFFF
ncbi:MAG: uroporphyrinogen-III synthase [Acidobacteria bacterium]|nr:MAG: uroporphyrinogen-III synthase [Acidobacteriota bacterium]